MSLNHENTQFKNSNGFAAKIVHDMYWYQRFRNKRKHAKQSKLINPERNNKVNTACDKSRPFVFERQNQLCHYTNLEVRNGVEEVIDLVWVVDRCGYGVGTLHTVVC